MALDNRCPQCGTPNPPTDRLCGHCGASLSGAADVATGQEHSDDAPTAPIGREPTPDEPDTSLPHWLREPSDPESPSTAPAAPPARVASDLPAWLGGMEPAALPEHVPADDRPRATPELPAWLTAQDPEPASPSTDPQPIHGPRDVPPAWLEAQSGVARDAETVEMPSWLRDDQIETSANDQVAVPDAAPSWLQEAHDAPASNPDDASQQVTGPAPATASDTPPWLVDFDREPTTRVNATPRTARGYDIPAPPTADPSASSAPEPWPEPQSSPFPDWLTVAGPEGLPADTRGAARSGGVAAPLPDWLRPEADQPTGEPPAHNAPSSPGGGQFPEWLRDDSLAQGTANTAAPDDWLAATGPAPARRANADPLSWLREPTPTNPSDDAAPQPAPAEHVARSYPTGGTAGNTTAHGAAAGAMPPWLVGKEPVSSARSSSLPPWLSDLDAPAGIPPVQDAEIGDPRPRTSGTSGLPPWLEEPEPSGPAGDSSIASWLREPSPASATTAPAAPNEEALVETLELPAWLHEEQAAVAATPATTPERQREPDMDTPALDEEPDLAVAPAVMPDIERSPARLEAMELLERILAEPAPEPGTGVEQPARARRSWFAPLIASLILLGTILFILLNPRINLSVGPPPPPPAAVQQIGEQIAALAPGRPVLVAYNWDLRRVAELEPLEENLLAPLITRRMPLLLMTTEPQGALLARRRADVLLDRADGFYSQQGTGFIDLGYLAGGPLALARLATDFPSVLQQNATGSGTSPLITSLCEPSDAAPAGCPIDRLGMLVVLADEREDVQAWVEQVASARPELPLIFAVPAELAPLVEPYLTRPNWSMIAGLDGALALQATRGVVDDWTGRRADATAVGQTAFGILLALGAIPALWTGWRARRSEETRP